MFNVFLKGNDFRYEIGELLKLFMKPEQFRFIESKDLVQEQCFLLECNLIDKEHSSIVRVQLIKDSHSVSTEKIIDHKIGMNETDRRKILKRKMKLCIYELLKEQFKIEKPWGILTGIRPTKIVHELMDDQLPNPEIIKILSDNYCISDEKIKLMMAISEIERPYIYPHKDDTVSVYISIPFCPSRCLYCSFPSNPIEVGKTNIVKEYLEALKREIKGMGDFFKKHHKKISTLYIGGGTPTTLSQNELSNLLEYLHNQFDLKDISEITVEAGRPDTVTKDKLKALKEHGIDRISINPQTMNLSTLKLIDRKHTPEDIEEAVAMARELRFRTINMDLIVGLPNEKPFMIEHTMKKITDLKPENLTVHSLAIKNSSILKSNTNDFDIPREEEAREMLEITKNYAKKMGLIPYYMYRQKYMVGNLENIGYCLPKHECVYNIEIMEERKTIIGLGAGAISKIFYPNENRLERIPNVTSIEHYIRRVDEMLKRKSAELSKSTNCS